jgi:hypothetical protein
MLKMSVFCFKQTSGVFERLFDTVLTSPTLTDVIVFSEVVGTFFHYGGII